MLIVYAGLAAVGVAAAGAVMLLWRVFGAKAPKGVIALSAGLAMVCFVLWNDYSWFGRTSAALPESMIVTGAFTASSPLAPWTLLFPPVNRYAAVDVASARRHESAPALRLVDTYLITRHTPTAVIAQAYDCAARRRVETPDEAALAQLLGPEAEAMAWAAVAPEDAAFAALCANTPL